MLPSSGNFIKDMKTAAILYDLFLASTFWKCFDCFLNPLKVGTFTKFHENFMKFWKIMHIFGIGKRFN